MLNEIQNKPVKQMESQRASQELKIPTKNSKRKKAFGK